VSEKERRILESETLAKGIIAVFLGLLGLLLWTGALLARDARGRITDLLCGAALLAVAAWMRLGYRAGKKKMAEGRDAGEEK